MKHLLPMGAQSVTIDVMGLTVLFADLDFKVDARRSATAWNGGLSHGNRTDVVVGSTVIVTDGEDAFFATVEFVSDLGPEYVIHWDRPAQIPVFV